MQLKGKWNSKKYLINLKEGKKEMNEHRTDERIENKSQNVGFKPNYNSNFIKCK